MNIVFFASSTVHFDGGDYEIKTLPSRAHEWGALCREFPGVRFFAVTQLPSPFMLDISGNQVLDLPENVSAVISGAGTPSAFADDICALNPDVALQASYWASPFDWMCLNDSLVGEELLRRGIKTVFHPAKSELICFDKWQTHRFLSGMGLPVPESLYVHHELYWAERSKQCVSVNAYKEYVLDGLRRMDYPLVIKDTVGLSSYGMDVAVSFREAVHYLNLGRTSSDRLVQTFIDGISFGVEFYSCGGKTSVMPPFLMSVNKYGLTSPRRSVKLGPVTDSRFKIDELNRMISRIASELNFNGFAQADLIFKDGRWYIIELNPRLSGMSETCAASSSVSVLRRLTCLAMGDTGGTGNCSLTCSIKIPLSDDATMEALSAQENVLYMYQIKNNAARQEREKGYCELVAGGFKNPDELMARMKALASLFPVQFEEETMLDLEKLCALFSGDTAF